MDQLTATHPAGGAPAQPEAQPDPPAEVLEAPGFGARGRMRRRIRFLRKARELAYRDLGGLVFSLHRFGQRHDELVLAKLGTLGQIDGQLRALEHALAERVPVTVLREAGITACPRCAAIHSSEDRFCPNCGLPMARNVDLPIAGASATPPAPAGAPAYSSSPPPATHTGIPGGRSATAPSGAAPPTTPPGPPGGSSGAPATQGAPSAAPPASPPAQPGPAGEGATEIIRPPIPRQ